MIKILNSSLQRLGVIKYAISSTRLEEINGQNSLDFRAILDNKLNDLIDENSMFELEDDYFDIASIGKVLNDDDTYTLDIEAEHVSYRLNNPEYNVDYFAEEGTPAVILGKILDGTPFTVDTIEYTTSVIYYAQEAKSRRQILMDFADFLGGELVFSKFAISIVKHRGSTTTKLAIKDRNIRVMSKTVNKRVKDDSGNPIVSYECTPIYLPGDSYALGDDILLVNQKLKINEKLRVIRVTTNPYDESSTTFDFSNSTQGLSSSMYEAATSSVVKDKTYNGIKIGPEYGFEATRNDKKARAYFRSDEMCFQSGDGTGTNWVDRLYYSYDAEKNETSMVFNGEFSADAINAIKANIDVILSQTIITQTLYGDKAMIAELTVDELNTSNKIERYFNTDTSQIKYIRIYNKKVETEVKSVIEFITGVTDGSTEQVTNRDGLPVYWVDKDFSGITMTVTEWPVIQYHYVENVTSLIDEDPIVTDVDITDTNISIGYSDGSVHGYTITKDEDGHVTSIGDINITNGGNTNAPNCTFAETTTDGTELILTFDKAMADVTGKQAEFTVTYTAGGPSLLSANANSDGSQITLTFNKEMIDPTGKESQFSITT